MNNRQKASKMLKEAKRRISIDKEIVEVCTKELEQFYADQVEPSTRRCNLQTRQQHLLEISQRTKVSQTVEAQLNGTATQEQSSTWRMVEVRHENDSDIF